MSQDENLFVDIVAGQTLVRAGETGQTLYLVASGKVAVHVGPDPNPALRHLGPGALFGETAALGSGVHLYSATAEVDSRVLPLNREAIAQLVRANPEAGIALLTRLVDAIEASARRVAHASDVPVQAPSDMPPLSSATKYTPPVSDEPHTERPFIPPPSLQPMHTAGAAIALTVTNGEAIILDPSASTYLVGRPDPSTGTTPEVNLGPFDVHRSLSRRHACILRQGDTLLLREETGVANGTFCNDRRLASGELVPIQPGDKLRFGAVEVDVVAIQTTG